MMRDLANSDGTKTGGVVSLLKTVALVVTIVGAIPTAITAYHAWQYKVPFTKVPHRLAQYDLWMKNLDCQIEYKALDTAQGTKLDVGACPSTGDIAIRIESTDGKTTYEWIAYNELQKPGEEPPTNLIDLFIGVARADTAGQRSVRTAQAMEVVCQSLVTKNQLVRVVREGGKCFREELSPMRGSIDKREEVPCDTQCKAG
ncbi:hypothetical protein [Hyphomicrobium sp.]|uniref:hypothetical protein n=1 Tax=Hyphomicrobium sp. TaxID=82 RepID=UPI002BDA524C|nr:hypothetical protein [Hyphomicrobium sp.]HRN87549.1 hypothetical protein [Hyphomicrobium sp.]HRQ27058.1 hypothetical protein [Hyphomicrobium sp.]